MSQPFYTFCVKISKCCCCFCLLLYSLCSIGHENKKCDACKKHDAEAFSNWLMENKLVATILVVCSAISLEFLEFSTSKWGGSDKFNSKMNRFGKLIVFYGAIFNIFVQDVPRLVIQVSNI